MSNKITFAKLIELVANKSDNSKQQTRDLLKEVVAVVNMGLLKDGRVNISGLGIFYLKWRDARQGRNPQTGETIEIPAHNQVKFKPEAALRRFINRKYQHLKPEEIFDRKELHLIEAGKAEEEMVTAEKVADEKAATEKAAADEVKVEKVAIEKASETSVSYFQKKRPALVWKALILLLILFGLFIFFQLFSKTDHLVTENEKEVPQLKVTVAAVNEVAQQYDDTVHTEADMSINKPEETVPEELPEDTEQGYDVSQKVGPVAPIKMPFDKYNIKKGDSLWNLAKSYYENSYLWPNILRVNILVINNPDFLKIGSNIQIPHLEGKVGSLTQRDLNNIIEGYMLAYLSYIRIGKANAHYYLWVADQHNVNGVLEKYKDKINNSDWDSCKKLKGYIQIN